MDDSKIGWPTIAGIILSALVIIVLVRQFYGGNVEDPGTDESVVQDVATSTAELATMPVAGFSLTEKTDPEKFATEGSLDLAEATAQADKKIEEDGKEPSDFRKQSGYVLSNKNARTIIALGGLRQVSLFFHRDLYDKTNGKSDFTAEDLKKTPPAFEPAPTIRKTELEAAFKNARPLKPSEANRFDIAKEDVGDWHYFCFQLEMATDAFRDEVARNCNRMFGTTFEAKEIHMIPVSELSMEVLTPSMPDGRARVATSRVSLDDKLVHMIEVPIPNDDMGRNVEEFIRNLDVNIHYSAMGYVEYVNYAAASHRNLSLLSNEDILKIISSSKKVSTESSNTSGTLGASYSLWDEGMIGAGIGASESNLKFEQEPILLAGSELRLLLEVVKSSSRSYSSTEFGDPLAVALQEEKISSVAKEDIPKDDAARKLWFERYGRHDWASQAGKGNSTSSGTNQAPKVDASQKTQQGEVTNSEKGNQTVKPPATDPKVVVEPKPSTSSISAGESPVSTDLYILNESNRKALATSDSTRVKLKFFSVPRQQKNALVLSTVYPSESRVNSTRSFDVFWHGAVEHNEKAETKIDSSAMFKYSSNGKNTAENGKCKIRVSAEMKPDSKTLVTVLVEVKGRGIYRNEATFSVPTPVGAVGFKGEKSPGEFESSEESEFAYPKYSTSRSGRPKRSENYTASSTFSNDLFKGEVTTAVIQATPIYKREAINWLQTALHGRPLNYKGDRIVDNTKNDIGANLSITLPFEIQTKPKEDVYTFLKPISAK